MRARLRPHVLEAAALYYVSSQVILSRIFPAKLTAGYSAMMDRRCIAACGKSALARSSPRGHPPLQRPTRSRRAAPWGLRGAPSPIWVPRSQLRRRSGASPKVADRAAFAHSGISINGEPVLHLRQMYALVQRLHGGFGMGQSCRPDKRQSWPPSARGCRPRAGLQSRA